MGGAGPLDPPELRGKEPARPAVAFGKQSDLFTDAWGHPTPSLRLLSAYCHFSIIYRRSPVGLPLPGILAGNPAWGNRLNRVLQDLAWAAVAHHPLSGVRADV